MSGGCRELFCLAKKYKVGFTARFAHFSDHYYGNRMIDFQYSKKDLEKINSDLGKIKNDILGKRSFVDSVFDNYVYFLCHTIKYIKKRKRMFKFKYLSDI